MTAPLERRAVGSNCEQGYEDGKWADRGVEDGRAGLFAGGVKFADQGCEEEWHTD